MPHNQPHKLSIKFNGMIVLTRFGSIWKFARVVRQLETYVIPAYCASSKMHIYLSNAP
jgi:hypothetical protein